MAEDQENTAITKLQRLKWDEASTEASLAVVYEHVIKTGDDAADWYVKKKRPKQRMAYTLRLWAIIITAAAGVIPIVANVWTDEGVPRVPPGIASALLLLSATLVLLDQFLGASSGWMRYMKAHMNIKRLLERLEFDFAIQRSTWQGKPPTNAQAQQSLAQLKSVAARISDIVINETNEWAAEFKSALRQIEESEKAAEQSNLGGLNIMVTNGDACSDGWTVSVDDQPASRFTGKSAALSKLSPGLRRLTFEGTIDNVTKRAERVVFVPGGEVSSLEVTLA
jgi:hypothetical protein